MKHESLEQTARYWVGQDKQGRYMRERISKRFSLTQERGHEGHICEVLHEDSRSSMYKVYD
jgi:ribosomal protein L15E